jgi:TonB family protein
MKKTLFSIYCSLFSLLTFSQENNTPLFFPFSNECSDKENYAVCEKDILSNEILKLISPEIELEIISKFEDNKNTLAIAFVFEENKGIRNDIDVLCSSNELTSKIKEFLLKLKPNENNSIESDLYPNYYEFVFLINPSNQKLIIASKEQLEKLKYVNQYFFCEFPKHKNCLKAKDLLNCTNEVFNKHIIKTFRYPEEAIDINIQGKVICDFIIDKEGKVEIIKLEGPAEILEDEARRIITTLPQFMPGKIKGIPTKFSFMIPITFRLE